MLLYLKKTELQKSKTVYWKHIVIYFCVCILGHVYMCTHRHKSAHTCTHMCLYQPLAAHRPNYQV